MSGVGDIQIGREVTDKSPTPASENRPLTLRDYKRRVLRVLVHIQSNLDARLELEALAKLACFSPYHFHRIFKGLVGETVMEHVRRLRLERAAGQLKLTRLPITEVAFNAGYSSHEAFTRSFRSVFRISPAEFRATKRTAPEVPVSSGLHYEEGQTPKHFKTLHHRGRKMEIRLLSIEPIRVAFKRHIGPYAEVGATWDKLLPILGKEGLLGGDAQFIGICHDDPDVTPPARIRYDACVSSPENFGPEGDIGVQIIAGGLYAVTTHFGPYQKLGGSYTRLLGQWLPRSGHTLRYAPCFEVYLNDPQSTEPEDLITDIYAPLES